MGVSHGQQVAELDARIRQVLVDQVSEAVWLPTEFADEAGFRNRAKLVVGGRRGHLTFGILDAGRRGVDLRDCGLYEPGLRDALLSLCPAVNDLGLTPYDVPARSGEFKNLIVTRASTGDLMVRFVLRSPGQLPRLREGLSDLQAALPGIRVVSVNLHPEHKAVLSGAEEIVLTEQETLEMPVGDVALHLRPESFFQTNTVVAQRLYEQAAAWVEQCHPDSGHRPRVWDLYCGVGGFGLTIGARAPADVLGLEVEPGAIAGARRAAATLESRGTRSSFDFRAGDAAEALQSGPGPDVVVVNPPRRGIGALADALDDSGARHLVYSSCNVESLRRDLTRLSSYDVVAAKTFDMFPQTHHHEVLLHLTRRRDEALPVENVLSHSDSAGSVHEHSAQTTETTR